MKSTVAIRMHVRNISSSNLSRVEPSTVMIAPLSTARHVELRIMGISDIMVSCRATC
jgi:hypothetical protein